MQNAPIRVLLADDHPLVRAGIRATLCNEPDIIVVGEAADGHEARLRTEELGPDVLLLDLNMPGPSAIDTVTYLRRRCPHVKVVILTAFDDDAYVRGLVKAGVAGYILKDEVPEAVARALHAVVEGGTWFSRPLMQRLITPSTADDGADSAADAYEPPLTGCEVRILQLLVEGLTDREIGQELSLAERTVRYCLRNIYDKLHVANRTEAAYRASQINFGSSRVTD
jgi:NarL family two-component system response regulator LiaR